MWEYYRKSEGRWYVKWRNKGDRTIHSKRRAVYIWEKENGKLPEGCEIHHINFNKADDRIENLQCIPRHEHRLLHGKMRADHKIINRVEYRRCQKCGEYKTLDNFYKRRDGTYQGYCKDCARTELKKWREKNREHWNKYHRQYRKRKQ